MISTTFANKILNVLVGSSTSVSAATSVYFGMCANEPSASGTVSGEPTGASYRRKVVGGNNTSKLFGAASGGIVTNTTEVQSYTAREAWGTVNYWFLSDTATGAANIWGEIYDKNGNKGLNIAAETVPTFYEGELRASIDVPLT